MHPLGAFDGVVFASYAEAAVRVQRDARTFSASATLIAAIGDHEMVLVVLDDDARQAHQELFLANDPEHDVDARTAEVARAVQDSGLFYGYHEPWPRCPEHPDATHSLIPKLTRTGAMWACPALARALVPIGELTTLRPRG